MIHGTCACRYFPVDVNKVAAAADTLPTLGPYNPVAVLPRGVLPVAHGMQHYQAAASQAETGGQRMSINDSPARYAASHGSHTYCAHALHGTHTQCTHTQCKHTPQHIQCHTPPPTLPLFLQ
jgi:hypothetical protein